MTRNEPKKVSIVVPTYNQGAFIESCLQSIRRQSYGNLEIIIQDSLSTDETEAICQKISNTDPRFLYCREKDAGQSDAINRGLKRSTGYYWTWICSDDLYSTEDAIADLVTGLENKSRSDRSCVGAFGNARYVLENGTAGPHYEQRNDDVSQRDLKYDWPLSQPASLLLKEEVEKLGGVRTDLDFGMDLDLFIRMLRDGRKLHYVAKEVAAVRLQADAKSVKFRKTTAETALQIIENHFGDIGDPSAS
jgi:glycosyltransferase involved in cell wall biosynthesis